MRRTLLFVLIAMTVIALSGCLSETTVKTDEGDVKIRTEGSTEGETVTYESTTETEEGEQTVKVTGTAGAETWCPVGGNWNMESTGVEGQTTATWKIDKLETAGKYAGLCHVVYTAKTPEGETKIDYWFDESGENGYYEMDINGQKISQEWHG